MRKGMWLVAFCFMLPLGQAAAGSFPAVGDAELPTEMAFTALDADRDGRISADEAAAEPRLAAGLGAWDRDGDGSLAYPEYARFDLGVTP